MITLTVTGHETPEMDREEIARLLKEYGVGAVCVLRNGEVRQILARVGTNRLDLGEPFRRFHLIDRNFDPSRLDEIRKGDKDDDIMRVYPPGTCIWVPGSTVL